MAKEILLKSYLQTATALIREYNGNIPLHDYLKQFFSSQKKYGSRDRKQITRLCYSYYRLGKAADTKDIPADILTGTFLCTNEPDKVLQYFDPDLEGKQHLSLRQKLAYLNRSFLISDIFPWADALSRGIDIEKFCSSFLVQPDLFIRIRPGYEKIVQEKLAGAAIDYRKISDQCVSFPNGTRLDDILEIDREAVIQDLNSQQTGDFVQLIKSGLIPNPVSVWDCCAASGGKSILTTDILGDVALTVSDVRKNILYNLKNRFQKAGIRHYESFVADLSKDDVVLPERKYSFIIADVPCSGSGTWSRTPEQLFFFDAKAINAHSRLQQKIISGVMPSLAAGGYFLYITCSVFEKENEANVDFIKNRFSLEIKKTALLKGYDQKADTLFAALFFKPRQLF